jgi:hypothetical protein
MEKQKTRIVNSIMKENKVRGLRLLDFIKTVWYCVGSRVGEAQLYSVFCRLSLAQAQPHNKARVRCRAAAFPKMFMSNNL